ncbi:MAG: HxsD-like protein [Candidatus Diapherotrites archaeon]|uniref:HxsD-like protein n=1 Tax=Candidatus Iainarchaeum sp. TaxID=3101447 RepID=A0A938YX95_9ARCH|nr:HxsD-like protein [Candidatus Diapherotrites archaeon]
MNPKQKGLIKIRQLTLDKGKNAAVLDLNAFFYPEHLVKQAAAAFESVCTAKVVPKGTRVIVELASLHKEKPEGVALNFCNYCLALKQAGE